MTQIVVVIVKRFGGQNKMKIDFGDYPVVIELRAKEQNDKESRIHAKFKGSDRKKLDNSIEKVVRLTLDKYVKETVISGDIKKEIENIMTDKNHMFDIYGHIIRNEKDDRGNTLQDRRQDLFNDAKYIKETKNDKGEPYLLSEIRVLDYDGGKLGYK